MVFAVEMCVCCVYVMCVRALAYIHARVCVPLFMRVMFFCVNI